MYCTFETLFYCDGSAEECAKKLNAVMDDLVTLLSKHPGVLCTACNEDAEPLTADDLTERPDTDKEAQQIAARSKRRPAVKTRRTTVEFSVEDGEIVRTVTCDNGQRYVQRCLQTTYECVARAIDESTAQSVVPTVIGIVKLKELPHTQVSVAIEFMCERGVIRRRRGRCYSDRTSVLDAANAEFLAAAGR